MLLADLVAASNRVASTASRLAKVRELADCLRRAAPAQIPVVIEYLSGETRQGRLGVAYSSLASAQGGAVAPDATLTIEDVDQAFTRLAAIKGKGSSAARQAELAALLGRATATEREFLERLILGELRQGALRGVMAEAVAAAAGLPVADVRRAAMSAGGMAEVAVAALVEGAAGLERFAVKLMRPVLPMLSQTAADTDEALDQLGTAALEWKLDGARVQAHKSADDVRIYTRNLNDVTERVPEIVESLRVLPAQSLILDGEAIGLRADGKPQPFQVTMRRFGRRLQVEATRKELPLTAFFFDCLLKDDEPLTGQPLTERHAALKDALPPAMLVPRIVTANKEEALRFMEDALHNGHEGVMAKALDAPYEAGRRGAGWLKVKRANTLDLVVLAAEWGSGRRRGWLSNLHLGARDPAAGGFVMLGKTFKGLADATLEWQTEEFLKREVRREGNVVHVRPEMVVEIAFNEVQESSQYPGGLALRFARVKGFRSDKRAQEADTIDAVRRIAAGDRVHTEDPPAS
ncbi:MAG TPA: ATP-dependent DNA ligase [Burkholderiales bacterium]|nr:ATP-dependent DNA ligase [Burkholderiales bacterium]